MKNLDENNQKVKIYIYIYQICTTNSNQIIKSKKNSCHCGKEVKNK